MNKDKRAAPDQSDNIGGNYYDKYRASNPLARWFTRGFLRAFGELVEHAGVKTAFELGAGEGYLARFLLERGVDYRGIDVDMNAIAKAQNRNREFGIERLGVANLYDIDAQSLDADLIVCCEVLEHLPDPQRAMEIIKATNSQFVLFSVPREPLWRMLNVARGKYCRDFGNTPGHIQHWSQRGFLDFVGRYFSIHEVRAPLPWSMVLCRHE